MSTYNVNTDRLGRKPFALGQEANIAKIIEQHKLCNREIAQIFNISIPTAFQLRKRCGVKPLRRGLPTKT